MPGLALQALAEGRQGRAVGEVEGPALDPAPWMRLGQLGPQRLGLPGRGAIGEEDVVAGPAERPHDGGAEAGGAAGDEDAAGGALRGGGAHAGSEPRTRQVFWPPNPKEFDRTRSTRASRASATTSRGIAGSGTA
ncbi:hypothetical protein AEGHOMDF_5881 [Methylobacterium soli]|nr:hypothetical protein AEGHOMDF_5881 [Methylobacterium soli]